MTIEIIGTGSYLPENVISNDYLATKMDTSDEWISGRTGIKNRRISDSDTTTDMATKAAQKALRDANITVQELDLIIVATASADYKVPSTACMVQAGLEADHAVCFDINAACSGFIFALNTAYSYIKTGIYKTALVIGAETLSKIVDWTDRGTCVLFGDGAGAAVVQASEHGVVDFVMKSDGNKAKVLLCKSRALKNILVEKVQESTYVEMDGQEVYRFAVRQVPECITEILKKTNTVPEEIKYFLLHQANSKIIHAVAKRLQISLDKFPMNLSEYGNTSAASIPILLDDINQQGKLQKGDKIILSGFGGGLTWGATLLEW